MYMSMCGSVKFYVITDNVRMDEYNLYMLCLLLLLLHSAGVGRTGTFIAVDAMMQRLKEKDDLDISNFVTQMRTKRTFMVQTLVGSKTAYISLHPDES